LGFKNLTGFGNLSGLSLKKFAGAGLQQMKSLFKKSNGKKTFWTRLQSFHSQLLRSEDLITSKTFEPNLTGFKNLSGLVFEV